LSRERNKCAFKCINISLLLLSLSLFNDKFGSDTHKTFVNLYSKISHQPAKRGIMDNRDYTIMGSCEHCVHFLIVVVVSFWMKKGSEGNWKNALLFLHKTHQEWPQCAQISVDWKFLLMKNNFKFQKNSPKYKLNYSTHTKKARTSQRNHMQMR
jgi:hypothetical protein